MSIRARMISLAAAVALIANLVGVTSVLVLSGSNARRTVIGLHWQVLAVDAAVVIALTLVTSYQFAQGFRRRLYGIEEAAALIAAGRLHHRVERAGERDEVDQLADQFNQMGEKLEQQVGLLQRLAEENRRLAADAQRAATMEERQRLARDLHDSVSQQLFALTMMAEAALRLEGKAHAEEGGGAVPGGGGSGQSQDGGGAMGGAVPGGGGSGRSRAKLHDTLMTISDLATSAQREMRALLLHLRPVDLAGRALPEAAASFLHAVEERYGLSCSFACDVKTAIPVLIEENLFRILQEAVANVLKHAEAASIRVQLSVSPDTYELSITDDGIGISSTHTASASASAETRTAADGVADDEGGTGDAGAAAGATTAGSTDEIVLAPAGGDSYGIVAMRDRAESLGGRFSLLQRQRGTTVTAVIPRITSSAQTETEES